jgi:NAD(P)H-hydrate repair Nnr-like enzyme with NAD(P)H-hydrate dehydratase domain
LILERKPWLKSTGAKTPEGKAISSQNAKKILTPEQAEFKALMDELDAAKKEFKKLVLAVNAR